MVLLARCPGEEPFLVSNKFASYLDLISALLTPNCSFKSNLLSLLSFNVFLRHLCKFP